MFAEVPISLTLLSFCNGEGSLCVWYENKDRLVDWKGCMVGTGIVCWDECITVVLSLTLVYELTAKSSSGTVHLSKGSRHSKGSASSVLRIVYEVC